MPGDVSTCWNSTFVDHFCSAGWEEDWIKTACEIVKEQFEQGYANIHIDSDEEDESTLVCSLFLKQSCTKTEF